MFRTANSPKCLFSCRRLPSTPLAELGFNLVLTTSNQSRDNSKHVVPESRSGLPFRPILRRSAESLRSASCRSVVFRDLRNCFPCLLTKAKYLSDPERRYRHSATHLNTGWPLIWGSAMVGCLPV